ncbi:cytidylate kinase-like family protein [Lachnospiraceae bacterium OM04-12BH]|jgi:cytidylate kinase|nr:cytidylate kinase-like family protein [Lachnospiraceae bacterium OM04-12BH]
MKHFVIAITRTCGSGGTTIAKMLANDYQIDMYDRKLLRLASEDSGINETLFAAADETTKKKPLFKAFKKVFNGELIPPESNDFTSNDNLFAYQAKVLKELTKRESYVVVGRAADYVLKDYPYLVRVFIHAPYESCVLHEMDFQSCTRKEAVDEIARMDAYRSAYYKYHTGREWQDVKNYDLSLDTGIYRYEQCTEIIKKFVDFKLGIS